MTCQIRASVEELEHAIIVSNDVMSKGKQVSGRRRRLTRVKIWLEE
jgi:hypothetical protein